MRCNSSFLILCVALLVPAWCRLAAQEEAPEPSPTPARANALSSISYVRLWYVGGPKAPRITLCTQVGQDPRVIASYVRPGRIGSYRLAKPGQTAILVLDGSVIPDSSGKIPTGGKPLVAPVAANFSGGAFHTIIVEEKDGKLATSVIEDKPPAKDTGPAFRIFDYTGSENESLQIVAREKSVELWKSSIPTPATRLLTGLHGTASIQFASIRNGSPVVLNAYEAEISPSRSYSVVLSFDRYGERSLSCVEDADSCASAEQIREFLKEN